MNHKDKKLKSGSYALLITLKQEIGINVGSLGFCTFPAGYYIYVGSALKGLQSRIKRHQRKKGKKLHWHIDYLIAHPQVTIEKIYTFPLSEYSECSLARFLEDKKGGKIIIPRFGSSDCRNDCISHLLYFNHYPTLTFQLK